jgi:hypothetical protein
LVAEHVDRWIWKHIGGVDRMATSSWRDIAAFHSAQGLAAAGQNKHSDAEQHFREQLSLLEKHSEPNEVAKSGYVVFRHVYGRRWVRNARWNVWGRRLRWKGPFHRRARWKESAPTVPPGSRGIPSDTMERLVGRQGRDARDPIAMPSG